MTNGIAKEGVVPFERASECLGVRVDYKFGGIEAVTAIRIIGAVNSIPVKLTRSDIGQIGMPNLVRMLFDCDALRLAGRVIAIEEAELYPSSVFREKSKIDALAIPVCSQRIRFTGPHSFHAHWFISFLFIFPL